MLQGVWDYYPDADRSTAVREYNVAHILRHLNSPLWTTPPPRVKVLTELHGIVSWEKWHHCRGYLKGCKVWHPLLSGLNESRTNTSTAAGGRPCKKRKLCRSIWCYLSNVEVSFLPANEHSVSFAALANGKLR